jgi:hypothetical protein
LRERASTHIERRKRHFENHCWVAKPNDRSLQRGRFRCFARLVEPFEEAYVAPYAPPLFESLGIAGVFSFYVVHSEEIMNIWYDAEYRMRRDEILASAARARLVRLATSGRSKSLRERIADGAQSMSDLLAGFARVMRGTQA